MADKITNLSYRIANVEEQLRARATAPQLGNSSLENKTLNQYDGNGILGAQFGVLPDGTNGAGSFSGPNPPQPTQASCAAIPGILEARWNGKFVDALSPLDLRHVAVYVVPNGGTIDLAHAAGTVSGELGDAAAIQMPFGTYQVYLVAWSLSGKWSVPSAPTTVVVPVAIDADSVQDALDELNTKTDGLLDDAALLDSRLDTAETDLTAHDTRIGTAETELVDAFGQISTVNTAAATAQSAADAAATAAASAAGIAAGKGKVLIQSTAPGAADRNAVTLWIDTTGGANTPKRWTTGTTWVAVTDKAATDAATAAAAASSAAAAAQSTATAAQTAASNAQTAADSAASDAAAAAGIANGKGKVLIQATAPGAADRNAVTLWIDTTGGANTPKRWSTGTTWVAVTDKAATDAASAAAAAASAAAAAQTAAGTAQSTADGAMTMAVSKGKVYYSTAAPSGTGTAVGDLWRRRGGTGGQEIIGEWQWTGSAWVSQTVSGSIVSNMDIGFLTAGSATMSQALIDKLVAGTANFQTVDVKNLFVTTGTMTEAVINKLWVDVVLSRKITVQMLAVGDFNNLASVGLEANGTTATSWAAGLIVDTTDKPAEVQFALKSTAGSGTYTPPSPYDYYDVIPGREVVFSMWIKASLPSTRYYQEIRDAAGAQAVTWSAIPGKLAMNPGTSYPMGGTIDVPTVWTQYWASGVIKAGVTRIAIRSMYFNHPSGTEFGATISVAGMSLRHKLAGELIVDGSITAASIAADAINGMVITGATFQTSALPGVGIKIDTNGFRAYANTEDGTGDPAVEIRPDGATVIGVTDPVTGDSLAALGSDGTISGRRLNIEEDPVFMGSNLLGSLTTWEPIGNDEPSGILEPLPRGVVAFTDQNVRTRTTTGERELAELSFDLDNTRVYRVHLEPLAIYCDPGGEYYYIRFYYTTDGSTPSMTSAQMRQITFRPRNGTGADASIYNFSGTFYHMSVASNPIRILITMGKTGYTATSMTVFDSAYGGTLRAWVEDAGSALSDTGLYRNGNKNAPVLPADPPPPPPTPTPTPVKKNYTKTYNSTGSRSYKGNQDPYTINTSKMYQGQSPASSMGILTGISTFPSMTSDLSGATITSIRAYFYFDFWYYNSGGTADIILHGASSLPSTRPARTNCRNITGWPKPGGMWVSIPSSYWAGFKNGTYRGVGLGDGTGGYTHYGYANGSKTKIEIKYTK